MTERLETPDPVERIHELNRLFLNSLKASDSDALATAGFPVEALPALRSAEPGQIEAAAEFPRALFDLGIEPGSEPGLELAAAHASGPSARHVSVEDTLSGPGEVLRLTIVYCAWSTSCESTYHARLFFGLESAVIHTLRTTALSALPRLALRRARVRCAFPDAARLWQELLLETRPEARRQLMLVALQPPVKASAAFAVTAAAALR